VIRHPPSSEPPRDRRPRAISDLVFPRCENPLDSLYLPTPLFICFTASSALAVCADDIRTAGHGDRRLGRVLWPPLWPWRVPLLPLSLPVPSVLRTVAPSPCTACSGDLYTAGNGALPPGTLFRPATPSSLSLDLFLAVHFKSDDYRWPIPLRGSNC